MKLLLPSLRTPPSKSTHRSLHGRFQLPDLFKLHFPEPPPSDALCKSAQWRRPRQSFRNVIFLNFNLSSAHAAQASRQNLPRAPFPASFNRLIVF